MELFVIVILCKEWAQWDFPKFWILTSLGHCCIISRKNAWLNSPQFILVLLLSPKTFPKNTQLCHLFVNKTIVKISRNFH